MAEYNLNGGSGRTYYIPKVANDFFAKEFDWFEMANWQELSDRAVELFVGYLDATTSMAPSGGGGGGQSETPWGRKDDEDDLAWARRCAHFAKKSIGIRPKGRKR